MNNPVLAVEGLQKQWALCSAANPQGKREWCSRPKCKRCKRGMEFRAANART